MRKGGLVFPGLEYPSALEEESVQFQRGLLLPLDSCRAGAQQVNFHGEVHLAWHRTSCSHETAFIMARDKISRGAG